MRAVLVGVDFGKLDFVSSLEELALLSKTAGAQPVASVTGKRSSPDAALCVERCRHRLAGRAFANRV